MEDKFKVTTVTMNVPISAGGMETTHSTGTLGHVAKIFAWKLVGFQNLEEDGKGICVEFGNGFQFESNERPDGSYFTVTIEMEEN